MCLCSCVGSLEEQLCPADTWRNNNVIITSFFYATMTSLLRRVSPGSRTSVKLRAQVINVNDRATALIP